MDVRGDVDSEIISGRRTRWLSPYLSTLISMWNIICILIIKRDPWQVLETFSGAAKKGVVFTKTDTTITSIIGRTQISLLNR
jgi:hypothetical protein